jgi:hypothetical protein
MDISLWIGVPLSSSARMPPPLSDATPGHCLGGVSRFQGNGTFQDRRKRTTRTSMQSGRGARCGHGTGPQLADRAKKHGTGECASPRERGRDPDQCSGRSRDPTTCRDAELALGSAVWAWSTAIVSGSRGCGAAPGGRWAGPRRRPRRRLAIPCVPWTVGGPPVVAAGPCPVRPRR